MTPVVPSGQDVVMPSHIVFLRAITYKIARDPDWYEKSK